MSRSWAGWSRSWRPWRRDAPLADSLALFTEGTTLIAQCSDELDRAEQQVVKLMKGSDGAPVELPFEEET